jgi:dipeptidyl aminopeptidase/acylaminoacyl peptidase
MRPAVIGGKGEIQDLAPQALPSDFPASVLVTPQQVIISAADGMRVHGQLFLPANAGDGTRHPAIVFFHGGSRRQMLLGWHYMYYYSNAYAMNQYLASRGYIVLSVNYRSGIGYGLDFREALNYGAMGASEFNDVEGAGLYLRSRADVDPQRIGLWGGSYGGYLTALGLARASDIFAAGVDMHGVHDWNTEIPTFMPTYKPNDQPDAARLAWESSPMSSINTWRSPVLLIQGDDDRNVPFAEMVDLAEALRKKGVEFEQLVFPDEIHDFLLNRTWLAAYHAGADFFERHLKQRNSTSAAKGQ